DLVLLVMAFAARGLLGWGMEVAGRRAASSTLSELRLELAAHRLGREPLATDGAESGGLAAAAVQGVDALEAYFARCLPVVVLAASRGVALVAVTIGVRLVDGGRALRAGLAVLVLAPELSLPCRRLGAE